MTVHHKFKANLTFIILILALLLAGCAQESASTGASSDAVPSGGQPGSGGVEPPLSAPFFSGIDGLGNTITLQTAPQRIISLAPSNTEILFAIGAGGQVVGRDDFSDFPTEAQAVQSIGGSLAGINTEVVVSLKPDLVLAAEINTPEQVQTLQGLGLTVYYLKNPLTLEDLYPKLELMGMLTGHATEAQALADQLKERVAAVDEKLQNATETPKVFYELDATDPSAPYTAGVGTFVHQLIVRAKGENVGASLQSAYGQMSIEALLVQPPDIILLGDYTWGGVTPEMVAQRAGWGALAAVKEGKVFTFDDNLVSRPGPRLVDGLENLASLMHPELFE